MQKNFIWILPSSRGTVLCFHAFTSPTNTSLSHHNLVPFLSCFNKSFCLFVSPLHFLLGDTDWLCLNLYGYLGLVAWCWEPNSCEIYQLWTVRVPHLCHPTLPQANSYLEKKESFLCRTKVKCSHLKDSDPGLPIFWHTFFFIVCYFLPYDFRTK